jgi:hypothetical protein
LVFPRPGADYVAPGKKRKQVGVASGKKSSNTNIYVGYNPATLALAQM